MKKVLLIIFILILTLSCGLIGCDLPSFNVPDITPDQNPSEPNVEEIRLSASSVGLALGDKTLSGKDNDLMRSYTLSLKKGQEVYDAEWSPSDEGIVTVNGGALTPVSEGETTVKAVYDGKEYTAKVTVGVAIASKEDFTTLAIASFKDSTQELLSGSYVLVNDIDYEDTVFYPIASVSVKGKFTPYKYTGAYNFYCDSLQWKALLEERFNDFDWETFSNQGVNPDGVPFSGIIEGNGYSLKNVAYMADNVVTKDWDRFGGAWGNIIGRNTGTIRNIAFEDLAYQEIKNESCGFDLKDEYESFTFSSGLKFGNPDYKPGATPMNESYMHTFSGIVYENKGVIENVYARIWRPEIVFLGSAHGCVGGIAVLNYGTIQNVIVEHPLTPGRLQSIICGSLVEEGKLVNCFALIGAIEDANRSLVYMTEDDAESLSECGVFTDVANLSSSEKVKKLDQSAWNIQTRSISLNKN